jgi:hypothetical protein
MVEHVRSAGELIARQFERARPVRTSP